MIAFILRVIKNEPVMVVAVVAAIIDVVVYFGVPIDEAGKVILLTPLNLGLALIARNLVTPTGKFNQEVNEEAANIAKAALDAPTWGDLEAELRELEQKARLKEAADGYP
jgi:hypothetical protein